jgi:hypothetical protein
LIGKLISYNQNSEAMLLLLMAGRNLSGFAHLIKVGTTDYKDSKALKSCCSEFFQIRVRLLYQEASPNLEDASFVVKKGNQLALSKKRWASSCFYGKRIYLRTEFIKLLS